MIFSDTLRSQYQFYFSKKFLEHAVNILRLEQFAKKAELPKRSGSRVIRFFRPQVADISSIQTLSEGVPINTFSTYVYDTVDFNLVQYGEAARLSDIVVATEFWDNSKSIVSKFGEDAALWCDTLIRNSIVQPGAQGLVPRYTGGATTFAALSALTNAQGAISPFDLLDAVTQLRVNKAPTINGGYVAILPPQAVRDIQTNTTVWLPLSYYSEPEQLMKGETGSVFGVKCVWATNPQIESGAAGVYDPNGSIFTTIVTGMDAYGVPKLAGDRPESPSIKVVDTPDSVNPLSQFITLGWKVFYSAGILNHNFGVALRHKSNFVFAA